MLYVDISRQNTQAARQAGRQTDIWGFPKMRIPANHPFIDGFSIVNLPFGDTP
jgi:hypothetical protein